MSSPAGDVEAEGAGEEASRRRHPTALWFPDVERMRRRVDERGAAPQVAAAGTASGSEHDGKRS